MKLIVGGTGALGRALVRRLQAAGTSVRVLSRNPEQASAIAERGAELVAGDLRDRTSLERACAGVDTVVAAAHSLFGRGDAASARVDGDGNRQLLEVARASGVRRFVYISMHVPPVFTAVPFVRIKLAVEDDVRASGLDWTIIRPTVYMEQHAHMLLGEPILRTGKTTVFGRGLQPRNFVAADDVARLVVRALDDPALVGRTITAAGPENLTAMDVIGIYERFAGRRARVRHMPIGVVRFLSAALRRLHPGISQVMQLSVIGDATDQSYDTSRLREELGFQPTRLEEWIAREVAREEASATG